MLYFSLKMPLWSMALYGSGMIVIVLILRSLLKNKLPKFVFPVMWGLVLVRLLVPFSISSPISAPALHYSLPDTSTVATAVTASGAVITSGTGNIIEFSNGFANSLWSDIFKRWDIFAIATIVGAIMVAAVLLYQKSRYSKTLKDSLLVEHNATINEILRSMGMGHILVFTNDIIASPLVAGIINPRIYLPARMDFKNVQLLKDILAHETMHIKRKDNWYKVVMMVVVCIHWYNPLVWIMSKCLSSDIEAACDTAVLKQSEAEGRQSYAYSLLSMAVTGNRQTLLYSAFSKTEVERRVKGVLSYKKASAIIVTISVILMLCTATVFATSVQAPFSEHLSSYCGHSDSRWGVKATLTRGVAVGKDATKRADAAIMGVLDADKTSDPDVISAEVLAALSKEFGVENGAIAVSIWLSIDEEEKEKEYAPHGITKDKDGYYLYKGELVRVFVDALARSTVMTGDGKVDVEIVRGRMGQISSVKVTHKGDSEYDKRTLEGNWSMSQGMGYDTIEIS